MIIRTDGLQQAVVLNWSVSLKGSLGLRPLTGFKGINFRCSNSTLTENDYGGDGPSLSPSPHSLGQRKIDVDLSFILCLMWVLVQKSLWGHKVTTQHTGVDRPSVTGHH